MMLITKLGNTCATPVVCCHQCCHEQPPTLQKCTEHAYMSVGSIYPADMMLVCHSCMKPTLPCSTWLCKACTAVVVNSAEACTVQVGVHHSSRAATTKLTGVETCLYTTPTPLYIQHICNAGKQFNPC